MYAISERESIGFTRRGNEVVLSSHVISNIDKRKNRLVQDIFKEPQSYESMILNLANRGEKKLSSKEIRRRVNHNEETFVLHNYCNLNDFVLEQAMVFSYKKVESKLVMVVVGYCWQITTLQRFNGGKFLYHNENKHGSCWTAPHKNHLYIKMPNVTVSKREENRIFRDYRKLSGQSRHSYR